MVEQGVVVCIITEKIRHSLKKNVAEVDKTQISCVVEFHTDALRLVLSKTHKASCHRFCGGRARSALR